MEFIKRAFGEFNDFFFAAITRVRFCLSYDLLKFDIISFKVLLILMKICILVTNVAMTSLVTALSVTLCVAITLFMT